MRATHVFLVVAVVLCAAVLLEAQPAGKGKGGAAIPHKCKKDHDCPKACYGKRGTCDKVKKVCVCDHKQGPPHKPTTVKGRVIAKAETTTTTAAATTTTSAPTTTTPPSSVAVSEAEGRSAEEKTSDEGSSSTSSSSQADGEGSTSETPTPSE